MKKRAIKFYKVKTTSGKWLTNFQAFGYVVLADQVDDENKAEVVDEFRLHGIKLKFPTAIAVEVKSKPD